MSTTWPTRKLDGRGHPRAGATAHLAYEPDDLRRLREAIRALPGSGYDAVRFECFARGEAEALRADLTPDERAKVVFSWVAPREDAGS